MAMQELVRRGLVGANLDIDTTAIRLVSDADWATIVSGAGADWPGPANGLFLVTPAANTGLVYFGFANTVTAGGAAATSGVPLDPGKIFPLGLMSPTVLWVIASANDQKCFFIVH